MCGVKLKDRLPSKVLRERLGIDDIALVLQQNRLRWYGHVLRKEDDDYLLVYLFVDDIRYLEETMPTNYAEPQSPFRLQSVDIYLENEI